MSKPIPILDCLMLGVFVTFSMQAVAADQKWYILQYDHTCVTSVYSPAQVFEMNRPVGHPEIIDMGNNRVEIDGVRMVGTMMLPGDEHRFAYFRTLEACVAL